MSTRPHYVLDSGALMAYAEGSDAVGQVLADVSEVGVRVAVPVVCLVEAYRLLHHDQFDLLRVLRGHQSVDVLSIDHGPGTDDCAAIGSMAGRAGRLGAGQAAFVALTATAAVLTSRADQIHAVLGEKWPVIEV